MKMKEDFKCWRKSFNMRLLTPMRCFFHKHPCGRILGKYHENTFCTAQNSYEWKKNRINNFWRKWLQIRIFNYLRKMIFIFPRSERQRVTVFTFGGSGGGTLGLIIVLDLLERRRKNSNIVDVKEGDQTDSGSVWKTELNLSFYSFSF